LKHNRVETKKIVVEQKRKRGVSGNWDSDKHIGKEELKDKGRELGLERCIP
jgi:hypothetical protein